MSEQQQQVTRWSTSDAGCLIDGHWGQYGVARMVELAARAGYVDTSTPDVVEIARRHLAGASPSIAPDITDDEHEILSDACDEVEQWMTEHLAPSGYAFEWVDGEFFLSPPAWTETLVEIRERSTYSLAGDAGCSTPDSPTSPGSEFLAGVRDAVVKRWEWMAGQDELGGDYSDETHPIADGAPDMYTYTKWQQFVDLAAWQEDLSEVDTESQDIDAQATIALYNIADRLASQLFSELVDADEHRY